MSLFFVTAQVRLDEQPEWLDGFREHFDDPYPLHVTLKNYTKLEQGTIKDVENKIQMLLSGVSSIPVTFSHLRVAPTPKGNCFMIDAEENSELQQIQTYIVRLLQHFGRHLEKRYAQYESNFVPHITIGRNVSPEDTALAEVCLKDSIVCRGVIHAITLTLLKDDTYDSWKSSEYQKTFMLSE